MNLSVRVVQVIEVVTSRGSGEPDDLARWVTQFYSFDGELLGESDPAPRREAERTADSERFVATRHGRHQ